MLPEAVKLRFKAIRENRRKIVPDQRAGLKGGMCKDCGGGYPPEAMDFDHRDPAEKKMEMSHAIRRASFRALLAEVAKCDLVCSNCHRVRTARRRLGLPATLPPPEYHI